MTSNIHGTGNPSHLLVTLFRQPPAEDAVQALLTAHAGVRRGRLTPVAPTLKVRTPSEAFAMSLQLRPSFSIDLPDPADAVLDRLRTDLRAPDLETRWARVPGGGAVRQTELTHLVVCMVPQARHFWSPWLHLDVTADEQGTHLLGRFGPHPSVWTGFALTYLMLGVIGFFAAVFAFALMGLGGSAQAAALAGVCALAAVGLWWASRIGQGLAGAQMQQIREALDRALAVRAPGVTQVRQGS